MIEIQGVRKTFKTDSGTMEALKEIDLRIETGEIFGIIGLSGAGKSTLLRTLNRLEEPDSGSVNVGGTVITELGSSELRKVRRRVGMIFQHFNLLSSRTVYGNVAFPLELEKWTSSDIRTRVEEMLRLVGLEDKASSYPGQLLSLIHI